MIPFIQLLASVTVNPHVARRKVLAHHAQLAPLGHLGRHPLVGQQARQQLGAPLGDAVQRDDVMAVPHKLGLVPNPHQLVLELSDKVDHAERDALQRLKLFDPPLQPDVLPVKEILIHPQVELLLEEFFGVLVDKVINLALLLKDTEGPLQHVLVHVYVFSAQSLEDFEHLGLAAVRGVFDLEDNGTIRPHLVKAVDQIALLVGLLVLECGDIEEEAPS